MIFQNKFYEVVEPFFHFRRVGHAESNTYIGRSMALTTVYESHNAEPGTQIHALVGGTFHIDGDEPHDIALNLPKPILEKTYFRRPDSYYLDQLAARGALKVIDKPQAKIDYASGRKTKEFPPLSGQLITIDRSNEFETIRFGCPDLKDAVEAANGYTISVSEMGESRSVTLEVRSVSHERLIWMSVDNPTGSAVMMFEKEFASKTGAALALGEAFDAANNDILNVRVLVPNGFLDLLPQIQNMLAIDIEAYADMHSAPAPR